jgi:FixJ family two-component response regulator
MSETKHIYIVDDDDSMRATLLRAFEKTDYQIHTFENAQLFLMAKVEHFPAVMLLDMNMPGLKGIDLQAFLSAVIPKEKRSFRD